MALTRRSKVLIFLSTVVAAVGIAFVMGPRPEVSLDAQIPAVPTDPAELSAYLTAAEARFDDIRPENEKHIVWANPEQPAKTEFAIVYLHGFSASRGEISPVCERVAEAIGANVFFARLRGHGRPGAAMLEASVKRWLEDALEALAVGRSLGRRVVVVGTSTGATLATLLASRPEARDLHALVLVSPNFRPRAAGTGLLTMPWGGHLAELVQGPERRFEPVNAQRAQLWTHRYPTRALVTMMALTDVVAELDLAAIKTPVLMIYSQQDQVVDTELAEQRLEEFGAATKQRLAITDDDDAPGHHVIIGDIRSPSTTPQAVEAILGFLASI